MQASCLFPFLLRYSADCVSPRFYNYVAEPSSVVIKSCMVTIYLRLESLIAEAPPPLYILITQVVV